MFTSAYVLGEVKLKKKKYGNYAVDLKQFKRIREMFLNDRIG